METGAQSPRAAPRAGYLLVGGAITVMMAGASAPSPFYPLWQRELHLAPAMGTLVFAVYAVALLLALLVSGSLSDHVGRRPVVSVGFLLLAASVALLWAAGSTGVLLGGRALQGVASGVLLSALAALVTDLAGAAHAARAAVVNSVAPMVGLAVGAVGAGLVIDGDGPHAGAIVFGVLTVAYAVLGGAVWLLPETSAREAGAWRALRPRVAVPRSARALFALSVPVTLAGWATGGLFLSLGASIVRTVFDVDASALQGITIGVVPAAGVVGILVLRHRPAGVVMIYGSAALAVGTLLSLVALSTGSFVFYLLAVVVVGSGFGPAFFGVVGTVVPAVAVHERAEMFAALYAVSYLAFGVPAVIAGTLVPVLTLEVTATVYGVCVAALAGLSLVLRVRSRV